MARPSLEWFTKFGAETAASVRRFHVTFILRKLDKGALTDRDNSYVLLQICTPTIHPSTFYLPASAGGGRCVTGCTLDITESGEETGRIFIHIRKSHSASRPNIGFREALFRASSGITITVYYKSAKGQR